MRIANRLIAFILSAAIIVVGVIFIIEIIAACSGAEPAIYNWHSWLRWGRTNTWKATSVEFACAIVAFIGLLLLLPQLRRRRPTRLGVDAGQGATDAALTRKGVMVTVRGAVGDVEGIAGSSVKVGRRRIQVNAVASAATTETANSSKADVKEAAQKAIDELRLTANRRLRVKVATRKKGGA